jgi:hypothetical protein
MKTKYLPLLGLAGLALSGLSAHAQISYTDGDLILDFSQSGHSDVEADIGSLASLISQSGGSSVQIGDYSSYLTSAGSSLNSLSFSIFGIQRVTSGSVAAKTSYLTIQQSGASPNDAPNDLTPSDQNTLKSTELGILGLQSGTGSFASIGLLPWASANAAGPSVAIIPNGNVNGYTALAGGFNGAPDGFPTSITPSNFTSGGSVTADLFELDPLGTSHQAVYVGDFTFNSNGTLDFTSVAPAPEPSVYAIFGVGVLWLGFRHQLRRNNIS